MKSLYLSLFLIFTTSIVINAQNEKKSVHGNNSLEILNSAKSEYKKRAYYRVIKLVEDGITKNQIEHLFEFYSLIGISELKLGMNEKSIVHLNKAKDFEEYGNIEQRTNLYWAIGDYYVSNSRLKEAIRNYKVILTINPLHEEARVNIGKYLTENNQHEEALMYLNTLIDNKTKYESMVRLNRAHAFLKMDEFEKAKIDLDICLKLDPKNPYVYDKLSDYYFFINDVEMCCKLLTKAIGMNYRGYGSDSDKQILIERKQVFCEK